MFHLGGIFVFFSESPLVFCVIGHVEALFKVCSCSPALPDSEHMSSSPVRASRGGLVPPLRPMPPHPPLVNLLASSSSVVSDPGVPSSISRSVASSSLDRVPTPMPVYLSGKMVWAHNLLLNNPAQRR